jgi:hypothetical protein
MKDLRGTPVLPGDELAYAKRDGNTAVMALYEVLSVDDRAVRAKNLANPSSRVSVLHCVQSHGVVVGKVAK